MSSAEAAAPVAEKKVLKKSKASTGLGEKKTKEGSSKDPTKKKELKKGSTKNNSLKKAKKRDLFDKLLKVQKAYQSWAGKSYFWVPHPQEVFCVAEIVKENEDGTVECLTEFGQTIKCKKDDVQPMNPPKFDGVEDLGKLSHLNEPSVLQNLKLRYSMDLIYTYSGLFLVAINPYKWLPIYTPEMVENFKGKRRDEVPPHIFAVADEAYRAMLQDKKNQSMLITGESGAGKTENTKKVIQYLASVAGRAGNSEGSLEQQILQCNPVLEAFGNAKTLRNNNSSRFGKFIEIQFNSAGYIAGATIQSYLLEKSRVVNPTEQERNFHIFYQLLESADDDMRKKYLFDEMDSYSILSKSGCYTVDGMSDGDEFEATKTALEVIGFTEDEIDFLWRSLSAVLHLGNFKFKSITKDEAALENKNTLATVAKLLDVDKEKLELGITKPLIKAGNEVIRTNQSVEQSKYNRDALIKAIYGRMFDWIVGRINVSLCHTEKIANFIGVLDISGFEIFKMNSFEQLMINYTNERLQQFFNHHMFVKEQEEYMREQIHWKFIDFGLDLQPCIDLIEKPMGVLSILNEQTLFPSATDEHVAEKIDQQHKGTKVYQKSRFGKTNFIIVHYAGEVQYDTRDWIDKNKDPLNDDLALLMQTSKQALVRKIFSDSKEEGGSENQSMLKQLQGTKEVRKVGARFMSVAAAYKVQLSGLMNILNNTEPHFIRCIIPNHIKKPGIIDNRAVLEQLRCNGVLEGIRISRKGFPSRVLYDDFVKRYDILCPQSLINAAPGAKAQAQVIVNHLNIDEEKYRMGMTKIFFKSGELATLEEMRELKIAEIVPVIQAGVRGFLARRNYKITLDRIKAARVIQRNLRSWVELRDWSWWKLITKVRPLLSTIAIGQKIKEKEEEIAQLNASLEERERQRLEMEKAKKNMEDELSGYRSKLFESQELRMTMEAQLSELERQLAELNQALKKEEQAKWDILESKKKIEERLHAIEDRLDSTENERSGLEKSNAARQSEVESLRQQLQAKAQFANELEESKHALENDIKALQDSLDEEERNKAKLIKMRNNLTTEAQELTSQLEDSQRENANLLSVKKRLEDDLKESRRQFTEEERTRIERDNTIQRLEAEIAKLRAELENERQRRAELERQKKKLEADLKSIEDSLTDQSTQSSQLDKLQRSLRADLDDTRHQLDELKEERDNLDVQLATTQNELSDVRSALSKKEKELADTIAARDKLDKELRESRAASTDESERLKGELAKTKKKLEGDNNMLTEQIEEVRRTAEKTENERKRTSEEARTLKSKLDVETRARTTLEDTVTRLEGELKNATTSLADERNKVTTLEREKKNVEAELQQLHDSMDDSEGTRAKLEQQRRRQEFQIQELTEQVNVLEEEKEEMEQAQTQSAADLEQARRDLKTQTDERKRLEVDNYNLRREADALRELAAEAEKAKDLAVLEKAKKALESELAQLNEQLRRESDDKASLAKTNAKLKKDNKSTKEQLTHEQQARFEFETKATQLENDLREALKSLETERRAREQFEKDAKDSKHALGELEERAEDAEQDKQRIQQQLRRTQVELDGLRHDLEENSEFQSQIEELRASYESRLTKATREASEAQKEVAALHDAVTAAQRDADAARSAAAEETSRIRDASEKARKKAEQEARDLQVQLDQTSSETKDLKSENKILTKAVTDLQRQLEIAQSSQDASEQVKRLEGEMRRLREELEAEQRATADAQRSSKALSAEIEDLHEQVEDAERARKRVETLKKGIEIELEDMREQLAETEAAQDELEGLRQQFAAKDAEWKSKLEREADARVHAESEAAKAHREADELRQQIENANLKSARDGKKRLQMLEDQIQTLEIEKQTAVTKASTSQKQLTKLTSQVRDLQRRVTDAESERGSAEEARAKLASDNKKLLSALESADRAVRTAEEARKNLEMRLADAKDEKDRAMSDLQRAQSALDNEKRSKEEMQKKLSSLFQ